MTSSGSRIPITGYERLVVRRNAVCIAREYRQESDAEIEKQRPIVNIEEVVFDPHADLGIVRNATAKAVDLGPAGDARLHIVAPRVKRDRLLEELIVRKRMRTRADQAHLTAEHVQELRQFIDIVPAHPSADAGNPRVILARVRDLAIVVERRHRAEFHDPERRLVEARTPLEKQHRTGTAELDQNRHPQEQRREQHERARRNGNIEAAFYGDIQRRERAPNEVETRDRSNLVNASVDEAVTHPFGPKVQ